ncbi:MAG: class I SAM-dependent methyltransferase, partial [Candidatus Krumholzibacteriota bacterium]|nr:class I SAM-dependent methyltransferase [Candidatus Krumholzibacteriota bacterium]
MLETSTQTKPVQLESWNEEQAAMAGYIRRHFLPGKPLNILEAGCGLSWGLDLDDVKYTLTGVDIDRHALEIRKNRQRDMDIAILGDLRAVPLESNSYDVIFSSYVLEHINGAERVMENFIRWLKPNGILILRIPNRDSARGFLTRISPFWFHVFYKKHVQGLKDAGKPGHAPFPTFLDRVVSRKGIRNFCRDHCLEIMAEFNGGRDCQKHRVRWFCSRLLLWAICFLTCGALSAKNSVLIYVIKKSSAGGDGRPLPLEGEPAWGRPESTTSPPGR